MVEWRPREYNSVADHLCNVTMDSGLCIDQSFPDCLRRALDRGSNLQIYSDGGFRSPNQAATGWALYECSCEDGCVRFKLLAQGSAALKSCRSSFEAEVLALEAAVLNLARLVLL